jgi:sigma-E factor negative regulatory protein RseA
VADNTRESLSALIDGEASEIELHRLLRAIDQDSDLTRSWAAYQQIRSVMGNHPIHTAQQHLEMSRQISAAIAAETDFEVDTRPLVRNNSYIKPLGGLAVAASITLAAFVGFNQLSEEQTSLTGSQSIASSTETAELPSVNVNANVQSAAPVQLAVDSQAIDPAIESYLKELPPEKLRSLRAYLSRYDRQMIAPNTRTVIHKDKKTP